MADAPEPSSGGGDFGFLTHKVGPLPVWMWAALAAAGYYWYTHYGPGAASSTGNAQGPQQVTDIEQQGPVVKGSVFKTNAEWEAAALNYLVGESVPPTEASEALYRYLHAQSLSAQQQGDVNLAIEGVGPPPKIPAPGTQDKGKGTTEPPKPQPEPRKPGPKKPVPPITTGSKIPGKGPVIPLPKKPPVRKPPRRKPPAKPTRGSRPLPRKAA